LPSKTPFGFFHWKHDLEEELRSGSYVAQTQKGPIEYSIRGEDGPTVVGIHGAPGGYDQVFSIWPDLPALGFRLLSWSRPGYLRTPLSAGRTYREQADCLAALMDQLGIDRAAVMGFSAGGTCALLFALHYPGRVCALILESAVSLHYEFLGHDSIGEHFLSRLMFNDPAIWLYNKLAEHSPKFALKSMMRVESTFDNDEAEEMLCHVMKNSKKVSILMGLIKSMSPMSLRDEGLQNDLEQLASINRLPLERITAPTLIFHGTNDADVPFANATHIAETVPDAELYPVEDGFHILQLADQADEVVKKRIGFIKHFCS
jgi:pimeloyl-ACP methyl ester carboxylesterase